MKFSESLKKNKDFQFVYRNGKSFGNKYLVMYVLPCRESRNRIGISVSKKVGNSVVRHRLTRLIRESYRLNEEKFVGGLDLIVIARPGAKERNFFEIESALLHLSRLHGIIAQNSPARGVERNATGAKGAVHSGKDENKSEPEKEKNDKE